MGFRKARFSVVEGAVRSGRQKGEGFGERGRARVKGGGDSGKHAFSVIEGAVKSRAIKGEGFGERGRGAVRGVGIYRLRFFVFF